MSSLSIQGEGGVRGSTRRSVAVAAVILDVEALKMAARNKRLKATTGPAVNR